MEAMIAWMGIRPFAISWPPERRAADANGAAHRFSQIRTPAVLPGGQVRLQHLGPIHVADVPMATQQRPAEVLLEHPDHRAVAVEHLVTATELEHRLRLDHE